MTTPKYPASVSSTKFWAKKFVKQYKPTVKEVAKK
jgi:hypothetical protein